MNAYEQQGLNSIKEAVDQILNVNSNIKRRTKKEFDKQRELFFQIITNLESVSVRTELLYADLRIDFSTYDETYLEIIDMLLLAKYGKDCYELITFYMWERIGPDGTMYPIIGPEGEEIFLHSVSDLWTMMIKVNPNLDK